MTKDAPVLNVNATKFEVLSHVSEREEQSEHEQAQGDLSRVGFLQGLG